MSEGRDSIMNSGGNQTDVRVFATGEEMSSFMLDTWLKTAPASIEKRGFFCAALSGGKTPVGFYRRLGGLKDSSLWESTHIFLVDERCVPPEHADSNYRLLRDTFLEGVHLPSENIHAVPIDPADYELSSARYEAQLKTFFGLSIGKLPRFDLILLGIGEDGHTASLIPGSLALKEEEHLTSYVPLGDSRHDRITLTLPVINNARNVAVLLSGANKSGIAKRVIEGKDRSLPASHIKPHDGRLIFLLDHNAASALSGI